MSPNVFSMDEKIYPCDQFLSGDSQSRPLMMNYRSAGLPKGTEVAWRPLTGLEAIIVKQADNLKAEHGVFYALDENGKILLESPFVTSRTDPEWGPKYIDYINPDEYESALFKFLGRLSHENLSVRAATLAFTHTHPGYFIEYWNWLPRFGHNGKPSLADLATANELRRLLDRMWNGKFAHMNLEEYILYQNTPITAIKKRGWLLRPGRFIQI